MNPVSPAEILSGHRRDCRPGACQRRNALLRNQSHLREGDKGNARRIRIREHRDQRRFLWQEENDACAEEITEETEKPQLSYENRRMSMEYSNYNKPKRPKKPMTEQQALLKLTTLCTQAEHCSQEMLDKMKKWELSEEAIARNMEFLTQKKFVDDERFARFFINDKIKYNKWGRRKVEQALWMKHIPKEISDPIFEEIEDGLYMETLLPLMKSKYKTIKAKNDYERSMKLIRFAMGRGFSIDLIHKCIDKMGMEAEDEDFEEEQF